MQMQMFAPLLGLVLVLGLLVAAFSGPSQAKAQKRRLTALRDRHSVSLNAAMEAQLRRITTARATRMDGWAATVLPNPALLKKRLSMTGKDWSVGQYGMVSAGLAVVSGLLR